jgi:carbonic anhydrase
MHRRQMLKALAGLALCPLCAQTGFAADWSYEGTAGPANWGNIDAASKVCSAGTQQSPVDIVASVHAGLPPLGFRWRGNADTIANNGHTIQVNFTGDNKLTLGKESYALLQLHFHRPSEHLIGGKNFPMEAHFVHQHKSGALAVVGVLMTGERSNPVFKTIAATMPQQAGPAVKADKAINPNKLLPAKHSYYRYAGSLTTPPCAETVEWLLLTTPIAVADSDIAAFAKLYPMNARPAQKMNRRDVLLSS